MLDDLKQIHTRDAADALGVAEKQPAQYMHAYGFSWTPPETIYDVIVAGMGGSALAAKAYKVTPGLHVPFEIVQDYDLPDRTHANTLLICSSYSGNTEETVSVLTQALDAARGYPRPMIIVVAAGGTLLKMAKDNDLPHIELPGGYQPRYTFGFQYRAIAEIFAATSLSDGFLPLLEAAGNQLPASIGQWIPTVAAKNNRAKQIAQECIGRSVVIYAGPKLAPAAYKWKINFNENAKQIAWWNQYSEFNHNEFIGWTVAPEQKPYTVIELRSSFDHPQIQKRFEATSRLLSGKRPAPITVEANGETVLEQLLSIIALGDFVSLYTALFNGVDPTRVDLMERMKQELA